MADPPRWFRALTVGSLIVAAAGISVFLFPVDCDGSFVAFDGIVYGIEAEGKRLEAETAFHPLFHLIALAITGALRETGLTSPGHVAIRIVSGLGAAALLLLIVCAAGRRRWIAGLSFAVALFATRSSITNAAVGETILPGCAAAVWAFHEATRTPIRPARAWTALVIALLVRADNVLIVPGVAAALWMTPGESRRFRSITKGLLLSAAATLAGYAAFWWIVTRGRSPIWNYFFPGTVHHWTESGAAGIARFGIHVDALSAAIVGRSWPRQEPNLWIGPGFVLLLLVAAFLLRSTARVRALLPAIAVTLVVRAIFFSWYDVINPKWAVLTLSLVAFFGARLAHGEPRWPLRIRIAGVVLVGLLSLGALIAHGPFTLRLRERGFIRAMNHAVEEGRGCRFLGFGPNVNLAFDFLSVPHKPMKQDQASGFEKVLAAVVDEVGAHPEPTLAAYERWTPWMVAVDPYTMTHAPPRLLVDDLAPPPGWHLIKWEGLTYAARYDPKPAESR